MKKISVLVLFCLIFSLIATSCDLINPQAPVTPNEPEHTCAFGEAWVSDAENHWHACDCGEKKDSAAHTPDMVGDCTVCGADVSTPVIDSIADALAIGEFTQHLVKFGWMDNMLIVPDDYEGTEPVEKHTNIYFEHGENYFHAFNATDNEHMYVSLADDGSVIAVETTIFGSYPNTDATEDHLKGVEFYCYEILKADTVFYGGLDFITYLYELAAEADDLVENADADALAYSFSFTYQVSYSFDPDTVYDIPVTVLFTLDSETYIVNNIAVSYVEDELHAYNYFFEQYTETVPAYTPDEVVPESFDLTFGGETLVFTDGTCETLNGIMGENAIVIENLAPDTALLGFLRPEFVVYDADGEVDENVYAYFYGGEILISFHGAGTWTLEATLGGNVYNIPFTVTIPAPTSVETYLFDDYYYEATKTDSIDAVTGTAVLFFAKFNEGSDPAYTAEVVGENAENVTLTSYSGYVPGSNSSITIYSFTANTEGTYTVSVKSTADTSVAATITVTVEAPITAASIASGKYTSMVAPVVANFYPTNDAKGYVVLTYTQDSSYNVFTYYIVDEEITFTLVEGNGTGSFTNILVNEDGSLTAIMGVRGAPLTKAGDTPDEFTGTAPEVPDAPAANVVEGGTGTANNTILDFENKDYVTTVAANGISTFCIYIPTPEEGGPDSAVVTLTFTGDVTLMVMSGASYTASVSGHSVTMTQDDYSFYFYFNNATDASVEITFSVSIV